MDKNKTLVFISHSPFTITHLQDGTGLAEFAYMGKPVFMVHPWISGLMRKESA